MDLARGLAALLLFIAAGCTPRAEGPVSVVVIGESARIVDPSKLRLRPADAVLMGAAAEGLVKHDAAGQIVPGLAERWNVSDDGLSYIFRLGERRWPDGGRVTARYVVRQLRAAAAPGSRNALAIVLTGIEEIVATTDDVLEIRLRAPRPNFLSHLAHPELGIVRDGAGGGPFRPLRNANGSVDLKRTVPDGDEEREESVRLEADRASLAVARFVEGQVDLVLGGTWNDFPVVRIAAPRANALRIDPAAGLFGLAVVDVRGLLERVETRHALSMAIDRDAIAAAMSIPGLQARGTLTAPGLSNLAMPARPYWLAASLEQRRTEARRLIAAPVGDPVRVRVAMPNGPGYRLLFAHLRRDWAAIGVEAVRVDMPRSADLRLVDAVAPSRGASWYLERFTCDRSAACDQAADAALVGARNAGNAFERAALFAEADRRLTQAAVFVSIAAPVRWSLVAPRITGFRANPLAVHSLTDLISESQR